MSTTSRLRYPICGFVLNMILGVMYAWSIFVLPLENTFGWKRAETSFTFTLIIVCFSIGTILGGTLLPRLKPTLTAMLGGLLSGAGFFLSSFVTSLNGLYLCYGVMGGLGIGLAYVVPLTVVIRWYPDKKGIISGLLTMGMALGTFFLGSLGASYLITLIDWQNTLRILGVVVAAVAAITALLLKFPPSDYRPQGYAPPPENAGIWGFSLGQALKTNAYALVFFWIFLIQSGGLMLLGHIVPFVKELNLTQTQAAAALGVIALANGGGRFFFGWLFDKAGRRVSMSLTGVFMIAGLVGLNHLPAGFVYPALLAAIVLIGMSYGGSISQLVTVCATFFGPKNFAIIFAFSTVGTIAASFVGPSVGGYIKDHFSSYELALYMAAALAVISILTALLIRQPKLKTS